ncbi:sulfite exporter TauE/SafE family protein [uncultured Cohaesibacter sp.]|uniref:sulfite exporter TauE/SafE family protein n=1 Tax=uncultured Cohaesibacter sp. TaxID=1002546 RepID=UPI0029C87104|nr:sulfite exporter TauE/SafE family protein [uncultured Cohaesibacter sp.]
MLTDPMFYLAAVPAVILVGLSKGGFGGSLGMLGVPMMALVISPIQAAAIFLPILICMDAVGVYSYWGKANWQVLKGILPFAIVGITCGWLLADHVDEDVIRLMVGLVALAFVLDYIIRTLLKKQVSTRGRASAIVWGTTAGFTSFVAHAGGPPYQIHTLPMGMHRVTFVATSVFFFATVNTIKLIPYFFLGQFSPENLWTTLVLLPIAPLATMAGVKLVHVISQTIFYRLAYISMFVIALKLCSDSLLALM